MLTLDYVKEHIDEIEFDDFFDRRFTWYGDKLIKAVDEYYGFGLYKADDFVGARLSHIKDIIMTEMDDEGYKITEFLTDGIVIDADGVGSVKITIERAD